MYPEHDPTSLADRVQQRLTHPHYRRWRTHVEAVGGCSKPVHLTGHRTITDAATGTVLDRHSGTVFTPCGNRRESVCPACSDRYAADAFHLLRSGMSGGKTIPETVADKPRVFVTVTAPGFGPVHTRRTTTGGKVIPCRCGEHHNPADTRLGTAIDPERYDYRGAVLWQYHAGALWHRLIITIRRTLAATAGIRVKDLPQHVRLSYAKVAEYQKRGLVHFHAVFRLDGPDGPHDSAPAWADSRTLTRAINTAVAATELHRTLTLDGQPERHTFRFGTQLDTRAIRPAHAHRIEDDGGDITDRALAGYIAKYAIKGTSTSEVPDRPIRSERHIDLVPVHPHHKRMITTAWELGGNDDVGLLRKWAHMFGFRGHFLTKSQRYSLTFQHLRGTRRAWQQHQALDDLGASEDTVLVINHWRHTGNGYASEAERELAEAIYQRKRQHRQHRHEQEKHP
ncbi:replication initiator [Qaidamihabitans albus]|uniref:replication initiator n=1 Tax=Qaidamihabitans albus TaxID=2795733 RepID=UPI0018F25D37|nr:replication initiator [Qaidamihabitans albus]